MPNHAHPGQWVKRRQQPGQLERIEAYFEGESRGPHRHDSYAFAQTLEGVHAFRYRGQRWYSPPGTLIVLHPDELHDACAGNDVGVRYRIVYIAPSLIQPFLGGRPLPFAPDCVPDDRQLREVARALLTPPDIDADPLAEQDALHDFAAVLQRLAGQGVSHRRVDFVGAERARSFIHDNLTRDIYLDDLAQAADMSRFQLCRHFRLLFGTSPSRYLALRRLERARDSMMAGHTVSDAALHAGFADQSHLTRQFSHAYGVSPARWLRSLAGA